jgi:acyl-CoA thioesterase II
VHFPIPVPILYKVKRLREGKSFATRKVDAIQKGNIIFTLLASFQVILILVGLEFDNYSVIFA